MNSQACYLSGATFATGGPVGLRQMQEPAPGAGGIQDHLDLLRRAAQMMSTGALTGDQAVTLSRQIIASVARAPGSGASGSAEPRERP